METMNTLYIQYLFFGQFFLIAWAVSQFISREKLRINYIYSVSYLFMGLGIFQVLAYSVKPYPAYYYISYFMIPFSTGSSLLLYFRYRFLIENSMIIRPVPFVLFLFSILVFLLIAPFSSGKISFMPEYIVLRPILDPSFNTLPLYYRIVHYLNFIPKIILSGGILSLLVMNVDLWRRNDSPKIGIARLAYSFAVMMFFTTVFLGIGDLLNFEFCKAAIFIVNTATLGVFFTSQYDTSYYDVFKQVKRKTKYAVSKVKGIDIESVIVKLDRIMTENELYRDEELTLKTLADMIDMNLQQLSEILNREIRKNFKTYVNDFRVAEATRMLREEKDLPITYIALNVGFNSTSTFNRVFSKSTGLTPKEYRKKTAGL